MLSVDGGCINGAATCCMWVVLQGCTSLVALSGRLHATDASLVALSGRLHATDASLVALSGRLHATDVSLVALSGMPACHRCFLGCSQTCSMGTAI